MLHKVLYSVQTGALCEPHTPKQLYIRQDLAATNYTKGEQAGKEWVGFSCISQWLLLKLHAIVFSFSSLFIDMPMVETYIKNVPSKMRISLPGMRLLCMPS